MIAVGANHSISLFVKHALHRCGRTDLVPHPGLGLQIESDFIRRFERGFGWTPRMKAHVVEAPLLAKLEQVLPRFDISRWITRERKISTVVCAAKINRIAVEDELISFSMKIAQANSQIFVLFDVRT